MPSADSVHHICLVGNSISSNWSLIQSLRSRYAVTMMQSVGRLDKCEFLNTAHLLVLDCSQNAQTALRLLPQITGDHPDLCVVLVDGGITQKQIASAFEVGVKDYFAEPYDVELLAERIDALCAQWMGFTKANSNCGNS